MWIWTETDEELQDTDEDVAIQVNNKKFREDSDAGSSESDYQPGHPDGDPESEDGLEYTDEQDATGSDGKVPKKGYQPDANVGSEDDADAVDEQDTGSKKKKQGLAGRDEIQKIRGQLPSLLSSVGQKRKAQTQKHEYLFRNGFSDFLAAHHFW